MSPPQGPSVAATAAVAQCPVASHICDNDQFDNISKAYPLLASTGCTARFCQSGRMKHTDEERVGRNQPIQVAEAEAVDFLYQLRREGIIKTEQALNERTKQVLGEIRANSTIAKYTVRDGAESDETRSKSVGTVSGNWTQSFEELEFGIRAAWKHARKCIMRSEYKDLKLCDLRNVKTSVEMASKLIESFKEAFNGGEVRPAVFVFPPREPNERGPMIWNGQLLSFAAYDEGDGNILGDPANAELTKAIIELGWEPPAIRTKWDLLPLVTMAQGDHPVITELPEDAFPLVRIQHPKHKLAFDKLGLRWVPTPALSRLGFTIGGIEYTATPFVGWFMDAEIGVRNLADSFRYNVLPDIVKKMGLFDGDVAGLPDPERLAMFSRAQLELNYAVSWSFAKSGVRMVDSLSASEMFTRFDDEHLADHGYRLPSDPYWLSPPQGSIVPIWHRGAAPNYQPRPMICSHAQDPIKAWKRETTAPSIAITNATKLNLRLSTQPVMLLPALQPKRRVFIAFCSSGTIATKLCSKLQSRLSCMAQQEPGTVVMPVQTLNTLAKHSFSPTDVIAVVASNNKKGEMPQNGVNFVTALENETASVNCSFAIFGNGSSDYADTFNQTARNLTRLLIKSGSSQIVATIEADNAAETPPWSTFDLFCERLLRALGGSHPTTETGKIEQRDDQIPRFPPTFGIGPWFCANIRIPDGGSDVKTQQSMKRISLDIQDRVYPPMSYVSVLTSNAEMVVRKLIRDLNASPRERLSFAGAVPLEDFFRFFVDLEQPFKSHEWALELTPKLPCDVAKVTVLPIPEAVACLPSNWRHWATLEGLCQAAPRAQPRKYSIASTCSDGVDVAKPKTLELLVQHHTGGRFSDICLSQIQTSSVLMCKIEEAPHLERMADVVDRPLILFATGSGMAPIRCLLQHRVKLLASIRDSDRQHAPISLFVGYKVEDEELVLEALKEARALGLFDILKLTPSNAERRRAQDMVFEDGVGDKLVEKMKKDSYMFSCAKPEAEEEFLENLSALLGCDVKEALGDRYKADTYQPAV